MNPDSLPTISNYGNSKNGGNSTVFSFPDGKRVYFSYKIPVAFYTRSGGLYVRKNDWKQTTGKHLNLIDNGNKKERISGDLFEKMLSDIFKE